MGLIASTRMYDVCPSAKNAWAGLLQYALNKADLQVEVIDHAWPKPISDLWSRPGLCAVFMCGWPFIRALAAGLEVRPLVGVIPAWPAYGGLARYRSEFLIRESEGWGRLEDSFGSRYGWMVKDSQSGWNAPRMHLSSYAAKYGRALFAESRGPYGNPLGLINALTSREIDITAIDGWYLDLIRSHCPEVLAGIQTIDFTEWAPNPLLIVSATLDEDKYQGLLMTFLDMDRDLYGKELLKRANVLRFQNVDIEKYFSLIDMEKRALANNYPEIA